MTGMRKSTQLRLPPGLAPGPEFGAFLKCWQGLPRAEGSCLPRRADFKPANLGSFMPNLGLGRFVGEDRLDVIYYGSEIERLSGLAITGVNYYDLLDGPYRAQMLKFHKTLRTTPCGAYMADLITTLSGAHYIYESLQLPLADETGAANFLIAFGLASKAFEDHSARPLGDHRRANVKEMHFLDLGAGAPTSRIQDFIFVR